MTNAAALGKIWARAGASAMVEHADIRTEGGDWSIQFDVSENRADIWFRYLSAECTRRNFSVGTFANASARTNSGSISIKDLKLGVGIQVAWDRDYDGPLRVRARSGDVNSEQNEDLTREFFESVRQNFEKGEIASFYRRGQQEYDGLPWLGELWFDNTLRLGSASRQYEESTIGPRVIIVDCLIQGIDMVDASTEFSARLREISLFLTVVLGKPITIPQQRQVWVREDDSIESNVQWTGYFETESLPAMPTVGINPPTPLEIVTRPDFSQHAIGANSFEEVVPHDIYVLWDCYLKLSDEYRTQFLQVAASWQESLSQWSNRRTLSFALMVVACESLKPSNSISKKHNIYSVVKSLLGQARSKQLQRLFDDKVHPGIHANGIRNSYLHRSRTLINEFIDRPFLTSYRDPSFDNAHRQLAMTSKAVIIEWLRRLGQF